MSGHSLMQHQHEGVTFLTERKRGLLAFEQGLGKTLVAIEAFHYVYSAGSAKRLLVLCPNSLKRNWVAEFAKFSSTFEVVIAEGSPKERRQTFATTKAAVVVTSYETARSEVTAILALLRREPTALVLDESHAAKNRRSLISTAVQYFAPHAVFRWLLSGTPVTNSPSDLYAQIEILAPGERPLGSFESFVASTQSKAGLDEIRVRVAPYILRRTKEDCLDLPEKTFVDIRVELPPWQRKLYDEMRTSMACAIQAMSGDEYRAFASTALAQLTRLSQIASNPSLLFPDCESTPAKFEELDGLVADILSEPTRKVIVWSSFVRNIEMLAERFSGYGAVTLYGGIPGDQRQAVASRFQNDPTIRILIANPAAAGTGFTLTAAAYSIYESLSWRYDFYAQSQDRNHRIGQSLPVTYVRLVAADTIEEAILSALERKSLMAKELLGDDLLRPAISEFTREQMCALLLRNELPDG